MAFKDEVSSLDRIATALEGLSEAEGAGIPKPTIADAGKVLMVDDEGKWTLGNVLPAVAGTDEGKVLTVDNTGAWEAANIPSQLPAVETTDEGKVLMVSSEGTWGADNLPTT